MEQFVRTFHRPLSDDSCVIIITISKQHLLTLSIRELRNPHHIKIAFPTFLRSQASRYTTTSLQIFMQIRVFMNTNKEMRPRQNMFYDCK